MKKYYCLCCIMIIIIGCAPLPRRNTAETEPQPEITYITDSDIVFTTDNSGYDNLVNIAHDKQVFASSSHSDSFTVNNVIDGTPDTQWGSGIKNPFQWIFIDLGQVTDIDGVGINWHEGYYARQFDIALSDDIKTWTQVYRQTAGTGGFTRVFGNARCRYIGILCFEKNGFAYSISELEIYRNQ